MIDIILHKKNNKLQVDEVDSGQNVSIYGDKIGEVLDKFNEKWWVSQSKYKVGDIVIFQLDDMKCIGIITKVKMVKTANKEYIEYYEDSYHNQEEQILNIKGTVGSVNKKYFHLLED